MLPVSHSHEKKAGLAFWAHRVLEECDKAAAGFASDPVHDLRVAIRRCRSMADGFLTVDPDPAWKRMKRLAKPLFSSLGGLRDTQVMMEWVTKLGGEGDAVAHELLAALAQKEMQQKAAAQQALAAFDRKHWTTLNAHLAKRTGRVPLEGSVFQLLALERWTEARELHRKALRNRSGIAYHQLRIGIKRFRYTVENFLPQRHGKWAKDLRELQDALGEVHDFDVLRAIVKAHPGIQPDERQRWFARISAARQERIDRYRQKMVGKQSLWDIWRADLPAGGVLAKAVLEKLRTWAAFLDPDVAHSKAVARLALQLYDGLSHCGILVASPEQRRLLEAAAWLHEVGRGANGHGHGHQKRGYKMICKLKPPLGWNQEEMRCVAALVRHHRGPLPMDIDPYFVGHSPKRVSELMPIIAVLRLANSLDGGHDERISRVTVETQNGSVMLYAKGLQQMSRSAERVAGARYLLEAVCRLPVLIRPMPSSATSSSRGKGMSRAAAN